jgi:predicted TIM-barrel fold metal-dependent hydrolase
MSPEGALKRQGVPAPAGGISRRNFLTSAGVVVAGLAARVPRGDAFQAVEPIIDIHQHLGYSGRTDEAFLAHQRAMGVTTTILLPAGRPVSTASTHEGASNGLEAQCGGNEACRSFALAHPKAFLFGANEVPDLDGATEEIGTYLRHGAIVIAEQKFGVECDSPAMEKIYRLAEERRVPVLMHWQFQRYNYGFERFGKVLARYPKVNFIGHAQTWWANIDRNHQDQSILYPKGPVTAGGLTDRYLSDYPNMYGDLSAGSGLNALTRDEDFTRDFLSRHRDRLVFGSDCSDSDGAGAGCQGSQTIAVVRRLAGSHSVERKLLCDNARRLFRL